MAVSTALKRKSVTHSSKGQNKKPAPSPSPSTEDIAIPSIYDDPMIDAPASSDSEAEDDSDAQDDASEDRIDELGSDGGEGFDDLEDDQPAAGPSRPSTKHLYAPPTLTELDTLQSTAAAGGTSFSLQLDALLASTLLPSTPQPALKAILSTLHSHILSLPSLPAVAPRKAVARLSEADVPWSGPAEFSPLKKGEDEVKWGLGWEKPDEVIVGGSWGVVGGYKKGKGVAGNIDLIVVMPSGLFSPKDRMSYRYFHKRTHYLAVIMASLRALAGSEKSELHGVELDWGVTGGDARRSAIVLTAGKGQGLKYTTEIRIHLGVPPSTFPLSSLQPSKSLLRHPSIPHDSPTPLYSTAIVHDTLYKSDLLHLHRLSTSLSTPRTVDQFLALWRIWAVRRGISKERGASGWFAAMILGWVVDGGDVAVKGDRAKTKRVKGLGKGLGSWQALRAAWEFLANTDFEANPVFLASSGDEPIPRSEFTHAFRDVLVDPSGAVNILAEWTKGEIELLRYHARETLGMLEDSSVDRFGEVFLKDLSVGPRGFDEFSTVDVSSTRISDVLLQGERPSRSFLIASSVESILRQGLTDRIKLVVVRPGADSTLSVGLVFDSAHATRVLDVGPSSEKTEAGAAYEKLWGDKAELRRFKDGSIAHSVVWSIARPEEAALIPSRIIAHLLERHFNLDSDAITSVTSDAAWSAVVQMPASAREAICVAGSEKLGFRPVMDAYDDLYKLLKSIDTELPLAILSVQPASEMLRYSSTFVPHPIDINRYPTSPDCLKHVPCAEVVLQFESSPRWPDDLAAVQKVKLAMFEKLARVVMSHKRGTKAGIVFDAARSEIEDSAALEVLTPGGVAFRIRIYHERERTLLERVLEGEQQTFGTALPQPPRRLAVPALELHVRRFIHQPQHHSALAPLHHRFPSYSSATRLLKRWFAAHMLGLLISTEVTEIIMAKVYLDPGSLSPPSSAVNGFVRALDLLASWEWKTEPLYVPLFSLHSVEAGGRVRFPGEKREEAGKMFEEGLKKDAEGKHAGWKVVTEEDLSGTRWTESVNALVAGRVRVLAKAAVETVREGQDGLNVKALFNTPTRDYDVLIHLHPSLVTRYALAVSPDAEEWEGKLRYRNVQNGGVYGDEVRVGFEPVFTLVKDIQRLYGDSLLVFYDTNGGSVVGLVWNPTKATPRALKPFLGYNSAPAPSEAALVTIAKTSVLGEIARLGKGLIERMESK